MLSCNLNQSESIAWKFHKHSSYEKPVNISFEQSSLQKQPRKKVVSLFPSIIKVLSKCFSLSAFQIKLLKQLKFIQKQNSHESLSQIEKSQSAYSTPKSTNSCYPATATNSAHHLEVSQARTSYERPGNISFEQSSLQKQLEESSFQIKLFKQLKFIQEQNSQILAIVKKHPPSAILPKINILPDNLPCDFPIKNQENLQELEVYLLDNQNFSCLVAYLAAIGGKDLTTQVNNVLRRLLSNDLASQFSFYGKRSNKKAFSTLKTKDLVIGKFSTLNKDIVLLQNSFNISAAVKQCSKEAKFKDIENSMKDWLKHAPHRYRIEIAKQTADL
ncbi:hypothetical protein RN001_010509 [Aquatica leii]|uniref:DUF4806 domain-containing protein n=1 Tax=Aquatica leii TaxID=1421715 RepID=A0AAN7P7Z4_9COLE|nr:hypothetical protein RN001_010509 [Aquatica leii]